MLKSLVSALAADAYLGKNAIVDAFVAGVTAVSEPELTAASVPYVATPGDAVGGLIQCCAANTYLRISRIFHESQRSFQRASTYHSIRIKKKGHILMRRPLHPGYRLFQNPHFPTSQLFSRSSASFSFVSSI